MVPQELADAFGEGGFDGTEVAVTKIQKQFFERISYLYPRVIPCVGAIQAVFIGGVLDNVRRVNQRETEFEPLHGEELAELVRQDVHRAGEVGGVCRYADVVDEIARWHNG